MDFLLDKKEEEETAGKADVEDGVAMVTPACWACSVCVFTTGFINAGVEGKKRCWICAAASEPDAERHQQPTRQGSGRDPVGIRQGSGMNQAGIQDLSRASLQCEGTIEETQRRWMQLENGWRFF